MDEIIIKEYSPELREKCVALLKETFPGSSDEKTFQWRYESLRISKPLIIVAVDKDDVVSFVSWIPWNFYFEGNLLSGYQACEGATKKEYRNKGLFTKMFLLAEELSKQRGVDFYFGFPSKLSYRPVYRAGYFPVAKFNFYKKILIPSGSKDRIIPVSQSIFDLNTHFIKESFNITPNFNSDYFTWRYIENPADYDTILFEENNNKALFIIRTNKKQKKKFGIIPRKVMLVDFQTTAFYDVFINNAFNFLFETYRNKASYITTFFNPFTMRGTLLNNIFRNRAKKIESRILCIKPLNFTNQEILFNSRFWDIMPNTVDYY